MGLGESQAIDYGFGMLAKVLWVIVIIVVVAALWVRLAPTDAGKWHKPVPSPQDKDFNAGVIRVLPAAKDQFDDLHLIALATPRTKLFAGSVSEGMTTYVTRSLLWGFSDYATVWIEGEDLVVYSRLRFGGGDGSVNRAKVEKWISSLSNP